MTGFRLDGSTNADNGFFQSIGATTEGQQRLAVVAVFRRCPDEAEREVVLGMLGLTEVAEGMLAASSAASPPAPGSATPGQR